VRVFSLWVSVSLICGLTQVPRAQQERPSDLRPDLPSYSTSASEREFLLPPLVLPAAVQGDAPSTTSAASGVRVVVEEFEIVGSTVLSQSELDALTAPYRGRTLSYVDLERVRDSVTRAYLERGYITSGAVLPEQTIRDGRVRIEVREGILDEIQVQTDGRLAESFVVRRLAPDPTAPVNVQSLQQRLQRLQADRRVRSVRANLQPTGRRGRARLELALEEEQSLAIRLNFDNSLSPSIGAERTSLELEHLNLTGFGDTLELGYGFSQGFRELNGMYSLPISAADTRLEFLVRSSESDVVEDPFESLDIESRAATYGVRIRQPVWSEPGRTLELSLGGEVRRSKSFLLGSGFSFSPGSEEGSSRISVVRFAQDLTLANRSQAFAFRSTFSVGLGVLGASTAHSASVPDSRFVAWLGQAQYARRFEFADAQLIARADVQLSDDPLLGLEQFSVGGRSSVRGYRENARVRDNGAVGSVELRVPVWRSRGGGSSLELAPFFDVGRSWNRRNPTRGVSTLASAGLGGRLSLGDFEWEVYWADDLRELPATNDGRDLQDRGVHVRVTARF